MYRLRQAAKFFAVLNVSGFLGVSGVFMLQHQSSAAFELGCFLIIAALLHWILWPDVKEKGV